jgi:hypothetical protein
VFGVEDIIDPSSFRKPLQIAVDPYESFLYQLFWEYMLTDLRKTEASVGSLMTTFKLLYTAPQIDRKS